MFSAMMEKLIISIDDPLFTDASKFETKIHYQSEHEQVSQLMNSIFRVDRASFGSPSCSYEPDFEIKVMWAGLGGGGGYRSNLDVMKIEGD